MFISSSYHHHVHIIIIVHHRRAWDRTLIMMVWQVRAAGSPIADATGRLSRGELPLYDRLDPGIPCFSRSLEMLLFYESFKWRQFLGKLSLLGTGCSGGKVNMLRIFPPLL
jgi:hypothetical protein